MANTDTKNIKTIQSLRGMKDIVNEESSLFTYFVENASKIAKNYGFTYIETPLLEETALFKRSARKSIEVFFQSENAFSEEDKTVSNF